MLCKECDYYYEETCNGKICYNRCIEFEVTNFYPYEETECKFIDDNYNKLQNPQR